jgi:hypothetical protein
MHPYFLQNILSSPAYKSVLEGKAVGATMKNLNVMIVSSLTIPALPIDMQDRFISFVHQSDKSKFAVQNCSNLNLSRCFSIFQMTIIGLSIRFVA